MEGKEVSPLLSNRSYDALHFVALILLPALGTLYFGLSQLWDLPKAEEVVGTVVLLEIFFGALLKLSNRSYEASGAKYAGVMNVVEDPTGNKSVSIEVDDDPYHIDRNNEVVFKVNKARMPE